ncbi:MAG: GNAT family N-acetyltransferase [Anaerolineaceae bacterium]|nr:GNAT family N-acetyltransferase [Anaerolineaceae bacterium]
MSEHREVMYGLMNLYLYDFSEFTGEDCSEKGSFSDGNLFRYWIEPNRFPFLIQVDGKYAGFILVRDQRTPGAEWATHHIAEFFIMRKYRRMKIGQRAAWTIFDRFPGHWFVADTEENFPAQAFWRKTITEYTGGNFQEVRVEEWEGPVQLFKSKQKEGS